MPELSALAASSGCNFTRHVSGGVFVRPQFQQRSDMKQTTSSVLLCGLVILGALLDVIGQELQIGVVDFYGLKRLSEGQVRQALTFKEGDIISLSTNGRPEFLAASESRLSMVPGVAGVRMNVVCCDDGRAIVYVGIQEGGATLMRFRSAPEGTARFPIDVVRAGDDFSSALAVAVQRGDAGEDRSEGHALAHDPAMRAIQERFITYARRDRPTLGEVLRQSSDSAERALAAQVLGYVTDKETIVDDLVYAMSDPSDEVRNNAMRALLVFAERTPTTARPVIRVPYEPFIALLNSPVWSDRNKASGALMALSRNQNAELFTSLRREAIEPLVEMARWKSAGHALAPFIILGRIAGYSEEAARGAWNRGEREAVISAAFYRQ
jgi:hypothetical protein